MTTLEQKRLTVRSLEVFELPVCLPFGEAFFRELALPGTFNPDAFLKHWQTFLTSYPATILVLEEQGQVIGGIGGLATADVYTGELVAHEFFWYIDQAHRGGTGAFRLLRAFKAWAQEHGATRLRLSHMLGLNEDKLEAMYRHLGFRPIEVGYDLQLGGSLCPSSVPR